MKPVAIIGSGILVLGATLAAYYVVSYPDREVCFSDRCYVAEFAAGAGARERGLSGRANLCAECAMLFVFPETGRYGFWMKGMRFPLDIVWLDREGTVVHVEKDVSPESGEVYTPGAPARYVIELNAGEAADVENGDRWRLP